MRPGKITNPLGAALVPAAALTSPDGVTTPLCRRPPGRLPGMTRRPAQAAAVVLLAAALAGCAPPTPDDDRALKAGEPDNAVPGRAGAAQGRQLPYRPPPSPDPGIPTPVPDEDLTDTSPSPTPAPTTAAAVPRQAARPPAAPKPPAQPPAPRGLVTPDVPTPAVPELRPETVCAIGEAYMEPTAADWCRATFGH